MSFVGLQESLEKLSDLKRRGLLSFEEHAKAMRGVLDSFGLGDANITRSNGTDERLVQDEDNERGKRVEILIHNLSHSDMALSVNKHNLSLPIGSVVARPKFSEYRDISEKLLLSLQQGGLATTIKKPVYSRSHQQTEDGRYPIAPQPRPGLRNILPLGFDISKCAVGISMDSLHFKAHCAELMADNSGNTQSSTCVVDAMYFPLLSVLVHKWLDTLEANGHLDSRKIVILISGRGSPTDPTARCVDNSTKATAKLVQKLLMREYPALQIITLHSVTNLFRYDENIVFVKRELVPIVDHIRNDLAHRTADKWKDAMGVTLSFADGSSARVSAINQSLSHYRPSYMHFWQLKTFWTEGKLCDDDIECHSFEEISTQPALSVDQTPSTVRMTVAAMQQFRSEFECIMQQSSTETDLAQFWLRKTKKPVLAILLVQKPGGPPKLYRATNMEVSMPTGSLCAERNVIGSALADDITLRRQDLKMIAVYSAPSLEPVSDKAKTDSRSSSSHKAERSTLVVQSSVRAADLFPQDCAAGLSLDMRAPECVPCTSSQNVMQAANTATSYPGLTVDTNAATNIGRDMKRSWSETSADSSGSVVSMHESPSAGGDKLSKLPRSPVIHQGQKRKILSMPSQPLGAGSSTISGGKVKTPRGNSGDVNFREVGTPEDAQSLKVHTNANMPTSSDTKIRKIRSSFSSGGLLGLDRHAIFNMSDDYEPELDAPQDEGLSLHGSGTSSRSFIVHESDMNPLKPCGACMEWLKKIASVNPQFTVITFTDYQCEGVYQEIIADA